MNPDQEIGAYMFYPHLLMSYMKRINRVKGRKQFKLILPLTVSKNSDSSTSAHLHLHYITFHRSIM
jgi:hypothetical protein